MNDKENVLTIGTFDGVHLGHQSLLKQLASFAKTHQKKSIVLTYKHHPLETLYNTVFPYLLTEEIKRRRLLRKLGIDEIQYIPFDNQFASISAEDFLQNYLIPTFHPYAIIAGYDTHFGRDRKGNIQVLEKFSPIYHYQVLQAEAFTIQNNLIISSSIIRDFIRNGYVDLAQTYLGYYYSVIGHVITGKQIGRTLGFPTINLDPAEKHKLIPGAGVYICLCKIYNQAENLEFENDEEYHFCVTNVGVCPSIKDDNEITIESHLIDFKGDLYCKEVELYFLSKIRNEETFESKQQLIKQIDLDIRYARDYFNKFRDWNKLW
ncbi:MAG TPA: bifunctional riboflavin kinase/FAD synthetase [Candidatus Cloacimonadota bacterium]|nr:bifunctional riboflavin kinase/FAD synthetase [Candidatus Cloacimonadota bacterium]